MSKVTRIHKQLPQTWKEAADEYIIFKQAQGLAQSTIKDYKFHLARFFKRYPDAYNQDNLKTSVMQYMSQKIAPATFNLRRAYLKNFFNWCISEGIFTDNPLSGVPKKYDEGRIRTVSEETLRELLKLPDKSTFAGLRDYTLFLLILDNGIRPGEATSLIPSDIDISGLSVVVRKEIAKTRRTRVLPISQPTARALKKLLQARHQAWGDDVPVFCTYEGRNLKGRRLVARFEEYEKKLGVKIRPYDLRHSFATIYLRQGGNPFSLQYTLGHSTMAMTQRYVHLTNQDLAGQHKIASPLNTLLNEGTRVRKLR